MYNEEALKLSCAALEAQKEFLLTTRPYIRQISLVDSVNNQKADYLYGVDASGITSDGSSKKIQFKCRKEGNDDFYIMATILSGVCAMEGNIGFVYKEHKYCFKPECDIYVETIGGKNYSITKEEIHSIEIFLHECSDTESFITSIQRKYVYADNGNKFPTNDYYVFIKLEDLAACLKWIFECTNPYLYGEE